MRQISILLLLPAMAGLAFAQPVACSQDTVVGTYALASQGIMLMTTAGATTPSAVPYAGLCLASIDAKGAVTCPGYRSMGGTITQSPLAGTVKINSDCSGSVDWGGGATANLVVLGEGKEISSMMTAAGQMGAPVISGRWKRISRVPASVEPNQCSPSSMVGIYGVRQTGTMMVTMPGSTQPVPAPAAMQAIGSVGYDGSGPAKGIGMLAGQAVSFETDNVQFVVKPDCTVTASFDLFAAGATMGTASGWGILLDGGNEFWGLQTQDPTGAPVILGTWKRLSPIPAK